VCVCVCARARACLRACAGEVGANPESKRYRRRWYILIPLRSKDRTTLQMVKKILDNFIINIKDNKVINKIKIITNKYNTIQEF